MKPILRNLICGAVLAVAAAPAIADDLYGVPVEGYVNGHPVIAPENIDKLPGDLRIVPPSYEASNTQIVLPEGYRAAWEDDRLNPMRGVTTAGGTMRMLSIWTDSVPRKLIQQIVIVSDGSENMRKDDDDDGVEGFEIDGVEDGLN